MILMKMIDTNNENRNSVPSLTNKDEICQSSFHLILQNANQLTWSGQNYQMFRQAQEELDYVHPPPKKKWSVWVKMGCFYFI